MKKLAAALLTIALLLTTGCSGNTNKETGNVIARHSEDEDGLYYGKQGDTCLLYTSPSPRDRQKSRMPSSA